MPRKRDIPKKKIIPDPIYKSTNVTRLTNMIMQDGKKRTAEKIVYNALSISSKKTKEEPKTFFSVIFSFLAKPARITVIIGITEKTRAP